MNCPYRHTLGNICTHKQMNTGQTKKCFCYCKNPLKCPLFTDWLLTKEKFTTTHETALKHNSSADVTPKNEREIHENP